VTGDPAIAQCPLMPLGVVAAIGADHARALQWMAAQSANRWNRVDQRHRLSDVVEFAPVRIAASGVPLASVTM